jgi:ABC-type branched-subunit amino acid transport system ATPase component
MGALMNLVERVTVLDYGQIIARGSRWTSPDPKVIEAYLGEEETGSYA